MKLLQLCVVAAMAAGVVAGPRVARAQAIGEAATLNSGVSSAESASGSALGKSLDRTLRREGGRVASSSTTSTSGGVVNLHWSRKELKHSSTKARTRATGNAKARSRKAQPDFVIFGADPSNADTDDSSVGHAEAPHPSASQPKTAKNKGSSGSDGKI